MEKVRMYKQVVELGDWEYGGWDDVYWKVKQTIENAETIKHFIEETKKPDVTFSYGTYYSPRHGRFCVNYKFVEEIEKGA